MVQSYKQNPKLEENYDAIIIGSGIGSLATGAILSKEGKKVLILEKHYTAGGFTHIFKRKDYEWDVGIHYIGEVQRPNSAIKKLFDYVTDGNLKWDDMGEVYDKVIIGDQHFNFVKGVKNFKQQMFSYFPKEKMAIEKYIDLIFSANKAMGKFYMDKAMPNLASKLLGSFMRKDYLKYSDRITYDVLKELTDDELLIKVLTAQYGDYGLSPKESSFAMHASVAKHYMSGGSFPRGGSAEIVNTIDPIIEKANGTILINAAVEEIIVENNCAIGVKMQDGKSFYSDLIISGAGIINTYAKFLPDAVQQKYQLNKNLSKINPSVAHGCLYIGLKGSPEELKLPKSNFWIYPEDLSHDECLKRYLKDIDAPFPVVYISFPAAKDSTWNERYPNKSTIDIITLLPYKEFEDFEGTRWMKRGEKYNAIKEKLSIRLLAALFKQLPHLEDKVDYYELSTPLTTKHFVNYDKGEIYGIDHSPERFRQKFLRPKTPIKNLYLTGQDIVTAGVGGALFAGLITASAITGKNMMKKIYQ